MSTKIPLHSIRVAQTPGGLFVYADELQVRQVAGGSRFDRGVYDHESGKLYLHFNDRTLVVDGFITEDDILQGEVGNPGVDGQDGRDGYAGADGFEGLQGCQGPRGPDGDSGCKGQQGPQGVQGVQGPTGPEGIIGRKGLPGGSGVLGIVNLYINNADPGAIGSGGIWVNESGGFTPTTTAPPTTTVTTPAPTATVEPCLEPNVDIYFMLDTNASMLITDPTRLFQQLLNLTIDQFASEYADRQIRYFYSDTNAVGRKLATGAQEIKDWAAAHAIDGTNTSFFAQMEEFLNKAVIPDQTYKLFHVFITNETHTNVAARDDVAAKAAQLGTELNVVYTSQSQTAAVAADFHFLCSETNGTYMYGTPAECDANKSVFAQSAIACNVGGFIEPIQQTTTAPATSVCDLPACATDLLSGMYVDVPASPTYYLVTSEAWAYTICNADILQLKELIETTQGVAISEVQFLDGDMVVDPTLLDACDCYPANIVIEDNSIGLTKQFLRDALVDMFCLPVDGGSYTTVRRWEKDQLLVSLQQDEYPCDEEREFFYNFVKLWLPQLLPNKDVELTTDDVAADIRVNALGRTNFVTQIEAIIGQASPTGLAGMVPALCEHSSPVNAPYDWSLDFIRDNRTANCMVDVYLHADCQMSDGAGGFFDFGYSDRLQTLVHEFFHALGLWHLSGTYNQVSLMDEDYAPEATLYVSVVDLIALYVLYDGRITSGMTKAQVENVIDTTDILDQFVNTHLDLAFDNVPVWYNFDACSTNSDGFETQLKERHTVNLQHNMLKFLVGTGSPTDCGLCCTVHGVRRVVNGVSSATMTPYINSSTASNYAQAVDTLSDGIFNGAKFIIHKNSSTDTESLIIVFNATNGLNAAGTTNGITLVLDNLPQIATVSYSSSGVTHASAGTSVSMVATWDVNIAESICIENINTLTTLTITVSNDLNANFGNMQFDTTLNNLIMYDVNVPATVGNSEIYTIEYRSENVPCYTVDALNPRWVIEYGGDATGTGSHTPYTVAHVASELAPDVLHQMPSTCATTFDYYLDGWITVVLHKQLTDAVTWLHVSAGSSGAADISFHINHLPGNFTQQILTNDAAAVVADSFTHSGTTVTVSKDLTACQFGFAVPLPQSGFRVGLAFGEVTGLTGLRVVNEAGTILSINDVEPGHFLTIGHRND